MSGSGKRDNAYYKQRLKKEFPPLYADVMSGRISVPKARQLAGLGGTRTRLHELKNAWNNATLKQQTDFMKWAGIGTILVPSPLTVTSAFDSTGLMHPWARKRIIEIMTRRKIKQGEVAHELGFSRLNASIGNAMRRDIRVAAATRPKLDAWLFKNRLV